MAPNGNNRITKVTSELGDEMQRERLHLDDAMSFRPVPHADGNPRPTWRIIFGLSFNSNIRLGLDINDEVILGRGEDEAGFVALFDTDDADHLGVSRRHAMLRPTDSMLYLVDLNSTNGTRLNGRSIGVNVPYGLSNGDLLTLGRLDVTIQIVSRPQMDKTGFKARTDLTDALTQMACTITSQLEREDVLKQALKMIVSLTAASEATMWLVDEQTGELFLEAGVGVDADQIQRLPVVDTLPGRVIETGRPLRANREPDGQKIKVKTGYLVEAAIYVPLTLGGVTFGVLSAVHRDAGKLFSEREEKVMQSIADVTAVAIQNARVHQATDRALGRRIKVVTALSYALSYDLKTRLNAITGYAGLLAGDPTLDEDTSDIAEQIVAASNDMARLFERLIKITLLSEELPMHFSPCDLVEVITQAVDGTRANASAKYISLDFRTMGNPYMIQGDAAHLHRSIMNMLDNAVKYSPEGAQVTVELNYWGNEIVIRVRDSGPGIPEEDLPYLFDHYFRSHPGMNGEIGIGLGLEIVRATAEAHRGTVSVQNVASGGAEFSIRLPATLRVV